MTTVRFNPLAEKDLIEAANYFDGDSIVYRPLKGGGLRVLAVAHHKRQPEYWRGRR